MLKKLTTLLVVFCFTSVFGQITQQGIDKNAPFFVNPNPYPHSSGIYTDVILTDTVGLNQNGFNAGPRSRGNLFTCTTDRMLVEFRGYHNPSVATQMWFCVYEGAAQVGIYNLIDAQDVSPQGPGEGWYSSGAISVDLWAGMYYMMFASFEQITGYWNENPVAPYPIPVSFGELTAGAGWNYAPTSNFPPDATQNVTAGAFGDPVAYYQILVTDEPIPVELMSFTFSVNENDVTLNWNTATETNNLGFEVQRKTANGEFAAIGFINGYGTTTQPQSYTYIDENLATGSYTYRLKQVDLNGSEYYYDELTAEITYNPSEFALQQNYPNPFNPSTQIDFSLAADSKVTLNVYSLLGEKVATLVNSNLTAGVHQVNFDAANLNSGAYFYRIEATGINGVNFVEVRKMLLTK
jgi:hypothetical protein